MRVVRLDTEVLRLVFTTDWHLSAVPIGRRTGKYCDQIMAKVAYVRDLTIKMNAIGIFGGDMFHAKSPSAPGNTYALINRVIETLHGCYLGKMYGTHGNHDLWADRVDSIPNQPIGTVIAAKALDDLSVESIIFENSDGSNRVQIDAYPYTSNDLEAVARVNSAAPREPGVTQRIVLMHQYGNPGNNPTMHGHPIIGFNMMADCDYDFALWGHDHSRTEPVTVGKCTHIRLGSLARAALAEDEVDRPIAAALLSFKGGKVGFKELAIPTEPLEVAFVTGDKAISKVHDSDEVNDFGMSIPDEQLQAATEFFSSMDEAVENMEVTDPITVMKSLCPENERDILTLALDCMGR